MPSAIKSHAFIGIVNYILTDSSYVLLESHETPQDSVPDIVREDFVCHIHAKVIAWRGLKSLDLYIFIDMFAFIYLFIHILHNQHKTVERICSIAILLFFIGASQTTRQRASLNSMLFIWIIYWAPNTVPKCICVIVTFACIQKYIWPQINGRINNTRTITILVWHVVGRIKVIVHHVCNRHNCTIEAYIFRGRHRNDMYFNIGQPPKRYVSTSGNGCGNKWIIV